MNFFNEKRAFVLVFMFLLIFISSYDGFSKSGNSPELKNVENRIGMGNPAAVYCEELGYEYQKIDTLNGQKGLCKFSERKTCDSWNFLRGECGKRHSYCSKLGYEMITKNDGRNSLSSDYAVCVSNGVEIGAVDELMELSELATVSTFYSLEEDYQPGEDDILDDLPPFLDYRNFQGKNWMTSIKDQGICGSCWAFADVGAIESKYNLILNNPEFDLDLSEQYLVSDCLLDNNCCGGYISDSLNYIKDFGIPDENCMSYIDSYGCNCRGGFCNSYICNYSYGGNEICSDTTCNDRCEDWANRVIKIDDFYRLPYSFLIKLFLVGSGPLVAIVGIGSKAGGYVDENGIYRCDDDSVKNHGVVIVGYNNSGSYWVARNSWGVNFGEDGYYKVGYGECGIESYVYSISASPSNLPIKCGDTINQDTKLYYDMLGCSDDGLVIGEDDITLDCNGHKIRGMGDGRGVYINNKENVKIKNCEVSNFNTGITIVSSRWNYVRDNILKNNSRGVGMSYNSRNNIIVGNTFSENEDGLYLGGYDVGNNYILDNVGCDNTYMDLRCVNTPGNNIGSGNYFNNVDGCENVDSSLCHGHGVNCGESITENVTMIYDLICEENGIIIDNKNNITLNCDNHTIFGAGPYGSDSGILLREATNVKIMNCNIVGFFKGIDIIDSDENTLVNNFINNTEIGILLSRSVNNSISNNVISGNFGGLYLHYNSYGNLIIDNEACGNEFDLYCSYDSGSDGYNNRFGNVYGCLEVEYNLCHAYCGDGICGTGETDTNCPYDCGCFATGCDTQAPAGCWCDSVCVSYGDCCEDACLECGYCNEENGGGKQLPYEEIIIPEGIQYSPKFIFNKILETIMEKLNLNNLFTILK